jgi:hypothetical protein
MDYRNYIKTKFGLQDSSKLLDPAVYSNEALEGDTLELEIEREETELKIDELNAEQEAIYDEGAGAPEYKKQSLNKEAELIENERIQYEESYQTQTDKLGLLRAVRGVRKRMKSSDLTIDQLMEDTSSTEVEAAVRGELRDLKLDSKKVNKIMGALNISAKVSSSSKGSNSSSKHIERMEQREEEREYETRTSSNNRSRSRSDD